MEQQQQTNTNAQQQQHHSRNRNNNRRRQNNNNNRSNANGDDTEKQQEQYHKPSGGAALQARDENVAPKDKNLSMPAAKSQQQQQGGQQQQQQQQQQSKARNNNNNNNRNNQNNRNNNNSTHTSTNNKKKNTESFTPDHSAPDMRVVIDCAKDKLSVKLSTRDVLLCPNLFTQPGDEDIHDRLIKEIKACSVPEERLLKLWHGDSHLIADDKTGFAKHCPTFQMIVERIKKYFNMKVNATRFNLYRNTAEWKPFHFDAAQFNPNLAKIQNITVGVSFGVTRDADFEHAETKKIVSFPLTNGSTYVFGQEANCIWRHGIRQLPPSKQTEESRISIICWGWVDQVAWEKL